MEAGSDLEQAADAATDLRATGGRRRDAREDPEQRRLPRSVLSDDPEHLALLELERDVLQRPDLGPPLAPVLDPLDESPRACGDRVAERVVRRVELADAVELRDPLDGDCGRCHQMLSAKRGSCRLKTNSPTASVTKVVPRLVPSCVTGGNGAPNTAQRNAPRTPAIGLSEASSCHL